MNILKNNNDQPLHKQLQEFDSEINRVNDFFYLLNSIDFNHLNPKPDHHNLTRFLNNDRD